MKLSNFLFFVSLLFISILSFHSCNEDGYDIKGNPDNLIFVKTNYKFDISRSPMAGVETVKGDEILVKIPVYATRPVESEVIVNADVDLSLVEQYNTANSVEYDGIDGNLIEWKKKTVKFLPGAYVASDSIEFSIPKENCVNLLNESYIVPIRLTNASSCAISLNNRYSYAVVNCEYTYLDSEAEEMKGVALTDKSAWEISSDDSSTDLSKCVDGELSSWTLFSKVENPTVMIDLKTLQSICGVMVYTSEDYGARLRYLSWSLSSDGKSWTDICALTNPKNISGGYPVVLLGGFEARYLKFSFQWSWGWGEEYRQLGEINVYVAK